MPPRSNLQSRNTKNSYSFGRLFSVRKVSAVLWVAALLVTARQILVTPGDSGFWATGNNFPIEKSGLEIVERRSPALVGTTKDFDQENDQVDEGPEGEAGNEAPEIKRSRESVREWVRMGREEEQAEKLEARDKARRQREARRAARERKQRQAGVAQASGPLLLSGVPGKYSLDEERDQLAEDAALEEVSGADLADDKEFEGSTLDLASLSIPQDAGALTPSLGVVGEEEVEDEEEDEGDGEEEGGNSGGVEESAEVEEGRRRKRKKRQPTSSSWRGALIAPDGSQLPDPLSSNPFSTPAQLAANLLGGVFTYPRDRLFVTAENHKALHAKDPIKAVKNLPEYDPIDGPPPACPKTAKRCPRHRQYSVFPSCALVGNAGAARAARFGATIDKHNIILRINQGPTARYERFVGSRTDFRLLGKKWVSLYTSKEDGRGVLLPSEAKNATLLVSRVSSAEYEHLASLVRHLRPDMRTVYMAQGVTTRARWMLAAFREGMLQLGVEYKGGDAPSSGFIGIYFLLQICERIAVYGMSMEGSQLGEKSTYPYHYFHGYVDSIQLRAHPHHSFKAEGDLINAMEEAGKLVICGGSTPDGQSNAERNSPKCGVVNL